MSGVRKEMRMYSNGLKKLRKSGREEGKEKDEGDNDKVTQERRERFVNERSRTKNENVQQRTEEIIEK